MFEVETGHDPILARSDKRIRLGAIFAPCGLCLIAITSRILHPDKLEFEVEMLGLEAIGQALIWTGMRGLRRTRGWLSGVVAYVWLGAVLNGWALAFTGQFALLSIPLVAALVATFARWRMRRDAKHAGVAR